MILIKQKGRWGYFLDNIPKKLESALYNKLSYQREGWEFMPNPAWSWVRFYNRRLRRFPWGLKNKVIGILEQWMKYSGEGYRILDKEFLEHKYFNNIKGLRPYQVKAVNQLFLHKGGILAMPTGSGKTKTMIEFIKLSGLGKVLVIVHTLDLKKQWNDELEKEGLKDVCVATYQSLKKLKPKHELVVFDECHHVSANTIYKIAMRCDNAILVGLSATPYRAYKPETLKIIAALGEIVYKISIRELINKKYLCDAKIKIVEIDKHDEVEYWDTYNDIYTKFIVENEFRNEVIIHKTMQSYKDGLCLILVDRIDHGRILYSMLQSMGNIKSIFIHGQSKKREEIFEDVKKGRYDIIIASKIYGEGVDIPRLKTLIMAGGGKSSVKIIQQIGRLLRVFPNKGEAVIYDFKDDVKYLREHFKLRYEIYEKLFEVGMEYWKKENY